MKTREEVCNKALEYLDTPFHHQGRLKGIGIDCAGLIVCIAKELDLPYADMKNYARIPDGKSLREILKNNTAKEKTLNEAQPGDILLMRFLNEPQHVALLMPNNQIIHSYMAVDKVTIHNFDDKWKKRVLSVYEYKNIE